MNVSRLAYFGLLVGIGVCGGCSSMSRTPVDTAADPGVTFAAHAEGRGLVIDKMEGGQTGLLEPSKTPESGPQFMLYLAGAPAAAFWVTGPSTLVRGAPEATAPPIGEVDAAWDEHAIRLRLKPQGQPEFSTSVFKRLAEEGGPDALGQPVDSTLDLLGVYRADVVDAAGAPAGWIQVRFIYAGWLGPWAQAHRVYDGVLPAPLNGPLAVAAAAKLDAELSRVLRGAPPYRF